MSYLTGEKPEAWERSLDSQAANMRLEQGLRSVALQYASEIVS